MFDIALAEKSVDLNPGHWVDDIPNQPTLRLKVRAETYRPYRVAVSALQRRFGKRLRTDAGLVDFSAALGGPLADHILLDWDGVTNGGKPIKYDAKIAFTILTSDDDFGLGSDFRRAVEYAAERVAETLSEGAEEAAGNLPTT